MSDFATKLYRRMMRPWHLAPYRLARINAPTRAMCADCPFAAECPDVRRPADSAAKGGGPA